RSPRRSAGGPSRTAERETLPSVRQFAAVRRQFARRSRFATSPVRRPLYGSARWRGPNSRESTPAGEPQNDLAGRRTHLHHLPRTTPPRRSRRRPHHPPDLRPRGDTMTAHTDPVDHCHTYWYADVYAAANAGIPPDVHHCNRWRADHPGDHLCCCGTTRPREQATDRHQAVASSPQPPAPHLEGDTMTTTP